METIGRICWVDGVWLEYLKGMCAEHALIEVTEVTLINMSFALFTGSTAP